MFVTLWILAGFFKQMKHVLFVNLHNNQLFQAEVKLERLIATQDLAATCTQQIQTQIVQIINNHLHQLFNQIQRKDQMIQVAMVCILLTLIIINHFLQVFLVNSRGLLEVAIVVVFFAMNTNPATYIAYISNDGTYFRNSDQNKKQNIQKKTNYQDQLNKILKLDIVYYSYDLNYTERIQELQQFLQDENLTDEKRKEIQKDIFQIQVQQSQTQQGFTYQNLQECGFSYVLNNKQVMNDQFLDQKGFDKDEIKQETNSNQQLTISESNYNPYLIMGIKALNEKIEQQSQRLDVIDQAMMKTHKIIYEVSSQADQKINDEQQNSLLNSINSDNIDDIKNNLNKLIYQFETSQKKLQKFQNQITFLNSQIEQQQQIIDKQQQDIINLKLKAKIV